MSRRFSYTIPFIDDLFILLLALLVYWCIDRFNRAILLMILTCMTFILSALRLPDRRALFLILVGLLSLILFPDIRCDLDLFSSERGPVEVELVLTEDPIPIKNHQVIITGEVYGIAYTGHETSIKGAYGRITTLGVVEEELFWGERLRIEITGVAEDLCFFSSVEVLDSDVPKLLKWRKWAIQRMLKTLSQLPYEERQLSRLLLLGESSDPDLPLIAQITRSGTRHLIALSGMHLYVLGLCIGFITKKLLPARVGSLVSALFIICFIFIAGFKASLVRAGILFCISRYSKGLSIQECLLCTWYLQLMLFPSHMGSYGFLLSYAAIYGIVIGLVDLRDHIPVKRLVPILSLLSASCSATVMTLPLVLWMFGLWYPVGIVASLLLTPLIMLYMAISAIYLIIPLPEGLVLLLYDLIDKSSLWFSGFPSIDGSNLRFPPYPVTILVITAIRFMVIYGRILQNRREEEAYEQSISIRFTKRNTEITRE